MIEYPYAVAFSVGLEVTWSAENRETLTDRLKERYRRDWDLAQDFMDVDNPGSFVILEQAGLILWQVRPLKGGRLDRMERALAAAKEALAEYAEYDAGISLAALDRIKAIEAGS